MSFLAWRSLTIAVRSLNGCSILAYAAVSKTVNCRFESCHLCKARPYNLAGVDRANAVACDGKDCAHWP